ncbi:hypothetical protein [Saccharopolyspora sp. 5N708]|uniref:hypothetical protein n=1 Tax=Saccharopolyspora sp. 5N708 TaxID=3457424 RepID=UPI003FD0DD78
MQHTTDWRGVTYTYFFCLNRHSGTCPSRYIPTHTAEHAVEHHYQTLRLGNASLTGLRDRLTAPRRRDDSTDVGLTSFKTLG